MKSLAAREKDQYLYEKKHRGLILGTKTRAERESAFHDAYRGLTDGMISGEFLDKEVATEKKATQKLKLISRFLTPHTRAAEFGPGSGALAKAVAPHVAHLTLVDVVEIPQHLSLPAHCSWKTSDGIHLPEDVNHCDLIWSSHVVEHIHPDDLAGHLIAVRAALRPNGRYIIFTPNKFSGPHDISRNFSPTAEGLHLKEYTVHELRRLVIDAGYRKVICYAGGKGIYIRVPAILPLVTESILSMLPKSIAKEVARTLPVAALLGIIMVGQT